jgi:hypothetical protein
MASYPTSIVSFGTKSAGQTIQPAHVNDLQDEVVAVETELLQWDPYTPTWTNSGTANTLGNGTVAGAYRKIGQQVFYRITLTWGSTTSSGSGYWFLSTPVTAEGTFMFAAGCDGTAVDISSGNSYPISCRTGNSALIVPDYFLNSPVQQAVVTATVPFTWATGDILYVQGWFVEA